MCAPTCDTTCVLIGQGTSAESRCYGTMVTCLDTVLGQDHLTNLVTLPDAAEAIPSE